MALAGRLAGGGVDSMFSLETVLSSGHALTTIRATKYTITEKKPCPLTLFE